MSEFRIVEGGNRTLGMLSFFVCDEGKTTQSVTDLVSCKIESVNAADLTEHVAQTKNNGC
jgi:hypothetical protein